MSTSFRGFAASRKVIEMSEIQSLKGFSAEPPKNSSLYSPPEISQSAHSARSTSLSSPSSCSLQSPTPSISSPPTSQSSQSRPQSFSSAAAESDIDLIATQLNTVLHDTDATRLFQKELFREEIFRDCLGRGDVDVDELRRIVWAYGVPDKAWARSLTWKLFCGYLPPDRTEWDAVLGTCRAEYWELIAKLTEDPNSSSLESDHPLSTDKNSRWAEYFRDRDLWELIDRDVVRTHSDIHRFSALKDALRRILFAYVKTAGSATEGYRQGMNELAAPFLLCFADMSFTDSSDAEADAYYCFKFVMREMASVYFPKESQTSGIGRQVQEMQALLRIKDPWVDAHLNRLNLNVRFYALRWIRLWLAREFQMPDLMRLWDSILASEVRLPWIRFVCVAMIIRIRNQLLSQDFAGCMKLLLQYPSCDIAELLRVADGLRTANVTITRVAPRR